MSQLRNDESVPILTSTDEEGRTVGWVNMTEAAEILGVTRQHVYKRAKNKGFKSLRRLGQQPAYVLSTGELSDIIVARTAAAQAKAEEDTPSD